MHTDKVLTSNLNEKDNPNLNNKNNPDLIENEKD